jgi:large subunit ribosomal protein L9
MELILLADVENLGVKFDQVKVKAGYGRNYLLPNGLAKIATPSNIKHLEEIKKQQSGKIAKQTEEMKALAEQISADKLVIGAKAGTTGKLFGSVTTVQVAEAMNKQYGIKLDRKKVHLSSEVKELGTYKATVDLYKDVIAEITFEVVEE